MAFLPPELIHIIIKHVSNDRSTLYSLSLSSKQFNDEATRLLYSRMVDYNPSVHYLFIQALEENPKLAIFVRVYHVPEGNPSIKLLKPQGWHIWAHIRGCLQLMVNLKELHIPNIEYFPPTGIPPIIDEGVQPPFQLDTLLCFATSLELAPEGIGRFVSSQYRLKYFGWMKPGSLPGMSLPNSLKCIEGTSDIVRQLLCMKPSIREVRWRTGHNTWSQENRRRLELFELEAFRHLRILDIVVKASEEREIMRYIRDHDVETFVDLEVLILHTLRSLKDPEILRSFPKLSQIIITPPQSLPEFALEDQQAIIAALFAMYENLVGVDVCIDDRQEYRRWVKGRLLDGYYILSKEKLMEY